MSSFQDGEVHLWSENQSEESPANLLSIRDCSARQSAELIESSEVFYHKIDSSGYPKADNDSRTLFMSVDREAIAAHRTQRLK